MKRGPAFSVRIGSVSVSAYKFSRDNQYCLCYRKNASSARCREVKIGEKSARERARQIAIALANGIADVTELTNIDAASLVESKKLLDGTGISVHQAVAGFLKNQARRGPSETIPRIFEQFIRAKETMQRNGELSLVHVEKLRDDLEKFVADFQGPIGDYFTDDLQDWLNSRCDRKGRAIGPRRRRHIRDRIVALYNFARDNGYLELNEKHAAEKTARPRVLQDRQPTFTPAQFDLLINAAHRDPRERELVPALAIGAFGRMRMSEIARLEWPAIHLAKSEIDVSSRVAGKTGNARIIEMPTNLVKWLEPYVRDSGPVLNSRIARIDNRVRRFAQKIGLKWQRNVLRGSCASYLYALTNDLKYVAAQLGTSERTLRREYLERKTKADAEAWFAIMPAADSNILELRWPVRE